jgi:hypothetical protein
MAKANAAKVGETTYYLPEGAPVPPELNEGVRLVGPGAAVPATALSTPATEALDQADELLAKANENEPEELPPYRQWLKDDLVDEAKDRGLDYTGTKDDLVKRLDKDDEETE